mgnify:CR=1 FL=1
MNGLGIQRVAKLTLASAVFVLVGCSVNVAPPSGYPRPKAPQSTPPSEQRLPPAPTRDATPVEISRDNQSSSLTAEHDLLDQAEQAINAGNYYRGASFAERVLSMNVRNARAYELLAKAYWQQGQTDRAAQIARKGLRYADEGSYQAQRLMTYLR